MEYKFIKIKVKKEDYPHIAEAFATAIAFYTRQATYRNKKPLEKAEDLSKIAGRVNAAEMEFTND